MITSRHFQKIQNIIVAVALAIPVVGCGGASGTSDDEQKILIKAGDHILTLQDVLQKIPTGIEPADSASLFQLIVDNWIKSEVLYKLAESKLPDISEIDNKVAEYRNRLIVAEYLDEMKKAGKVRVDEDSVRYFYETYKDEMLTESPLVKGIYLKVSSSNPNIDQIKQLVYCGSDDCIDNLEQLIAGDAVQYDYFVDEWIDWQIIADLIPYRFANPDAFLKATKDFETSYNGSDYVLHVSDYLPAGSVPPFEFASHHIIELLERTNMRKYEESLVASLIGKALKDGDMVAVGYNPLQHKMLIPTDQTASVDDNVKKSNRQ